MPTVKPDDPIPADWALQLCQIICRESAHRRFSLARVLCEQCYKNWDGDPAKLGYTHKAGNRGCYFVNRLRRHYYPIFNA